MKRFLCLLTAFALILTFASCTKLGENNGETENLTTTAKAPEVKDVTKTAEIKDDNGRVVFTVEVTYPEFSKNAEKSTLEYVNRVAAETFTDACKFAESNKDNAAAFMNSFGSANPWSKKITFESSYLSGRYVCFFVKEVFSAGASTVSEPSVSAQCFDIVKGVPCDIMYFFADPEQDFVETKRKVAELVSQKALYDFNPNGVGLANLQMEKLPKIFDLNCFFIANDGMGFYLDRNLLDSTQSGSYTCVIPWAELEGIFVHPETVK